MSGKDEDTEKHGFPECVFKQMQREHDEYIQDNLRSLKRDQDIKREDDVFTSFKDFVDTNLNSLASSFRRLPNDIAELVSNMQQHSERSKQDELEMWKRWTGSEGSPDHASMLRERRSPEQRQVAVESALLLLGTSQNMNDAKGTDQLEIAALYREDAESAPLDKSTSPVASEQKRHTGYAFQSSSASSPRWLSIDWFKRSPYSPITLEAHRDLSQSGTKWRAAFEDLLDDTLGKPMQSRERSGTRFPHIKYQSTFRGPGLDWMLSLQCRGILPPQLPSLYAAVLKPQDGYARYDAADVQDARLQSLMAHGPTWDTAAELGESVMQEFSALVDEIATPASPAPSTGKQDFYPQLSDDNLVTAMTAHNIHNIKRRKQQLSALRGVEPLDAEELEEQQCHDRGMHQTSQDYELELMLLEQQNKKRLLQARREEEEFYEAELERAEYLRQQRDALGLDDDEEEATAADVAIPTPTTLAPPKAATEMSARPVDVLSSLTTTQVTRLPDGTVTKKVVLKQRFADGREVTEEKEHTYQESAAKQEKVVKSDQKPVKAAPGWFWT